MLAHDIHVIDLGGDNWDRLTTTLTDLGNLMAPEGKGKSLLVVYRGLACLKSIDLGEQREVSVPFRGTSRLDALAAESGYDFVIAIEETALRRVLSRAGRTIDYREDYFAGWWEVVLAAAKEWRRTIFTYPEGPRKLPVPPFRFLELALKAYVPDDTLLLLAFTDRWRAYTSIALGYRDGNVRLLTSLDAIGDEGADLSGEGLGQAAAALAQRFGGRPRAISIERSALKEILTSRFPLATALYAVNSREIALYKVPWRWRIATVLELLALPTLRKR
jgi:hypothetical protein